MYSQHYFVQHNSLEDCGIMHTYRKEGHDLYDTWVKVLKFWICADRVIVVFQGTIEYNET